MKVFNIIVLLIMCSINAHGYDFIKENVYYTKTSSTTVKVTYYSQTNNIQGNILLFQKR